MLPPSQHPIPHMHCPTPSPQIPEKRGDEISGPWGGPAPHPLLPGASRAQAGLHLQWFLLIFLQLLGLFLPGRLTGQGVVEEHPAALLIPVLAPLCVQALPTAHRGPGGGRAGSSFGCFKG